jgi:LAS superfamily LD-carboxypeptidase LdcB
MKLDSQQLTGQLDTHVEFRGRHALQTECWEAFTALRSDAAKSGIDLQLVSGFRSFERQRLIWNGKALGERLVHDDLGQAIDLQRLTAGERIHAIMRFSALPGSSRHHWGTDLDVYDAAAVAADYEVQLVPAEFAVDGVFAGLDRWLQECLQGSRACGFARPYAVDRGGVACEPWHLSYLPLAEGYACALTAELLASTLAGRELVLEAEVLAQLPELHRRYICIPSAATG